MPEDVLDFYRAMHPPRPGLPGRVGAALRRPGTGTRPGGRPAQKGHGLPGWEAKLPTFAPEDGPMATRKAVKACLDATGGLHSRRSCPAVPTSPATPAWPWPGPSAQSAERPGRRAHPLRHPRARDGRDHERHGRPPGHPPGRRHLLRVQRLHAGGGAAGRPLRHARHLLVDPRLDRPGPGRPHPPARRAAGGHAGHAQPPGDPAGRRQRDRPGLADRRRRRRAHRPHPLPPGAARAGRDGRHGPTRRVPGRLRAAGGRERAAPGRSHRHRQRGPALPGRRRPPRPPTACPPGWCPSRRGTCSPPSPTGTGTRCSRTASPVWPSRRPVPSAGSATPTPRCASTTSAPRLPARWPWRSSASPRSTSPPDATLAGRRMVDPMTDPGHAVPVGRPLPKGRP